MTENLGEKIGLEEKYFLLNNIKVRQPTSLTLTSKQWTKEDGRLDEMKLSRDLTHFLNRVNYQIFRKGFTRYQKRLGVISVLEGGGLKHLHCHLTIEQPQNLDFQDFEEVIRSCWSKSKFGYSDNHGVSMSPVTSNGWYEYQLKNRTKQDGKYSSIDWINTTPSNWWNNSQPEKSQSTQQGLLAITLGSFPVPITNIRKDKDHERT